MIRVGRIGVRELAAACVAGLLLQGAACARSERGDHSDTVGTRTTTSDTVRAPTAAAPSLSAVPTTSTGGVGSTAPAVRVGVARGGAVGAYLVDARGRALYRLEADDAGPSPCVEMCAVVWPPLLAGQVAPVAGDSAVQARLLGSAPRPGGGTHVTYGGRPLYYYIGDAKPGDTNGQHVEDSWGEWYLVSPTGRSVEVGRDRGDRSGGRRRGGGDDR